MLVLGCDRIRRPSKRLIGGGVMAGRCDEQVDVAVDETGAWRC